jgi:hypothetical protein
MPAIAVHVVIPEAERQPERGERRAHGDAHRGDDERRPVGERRGDAQARHAEVVHARNGRSHGEPRPHQRAAGRTR